MQGLCVRLGECFPCGPVCGNCGSLKGQKRVFKGGDASGGSRVTEKERGRALRLCPGRPLGCFLSTEEAHGRQTIGSLCCTDSLPTSDLSPWEFGKERWEFIPGKRAQRRVYFC